MFGYIHASNEALPPIAPPLRQPEPKPAKPVGPWTTQDTMSILYVIACLASIVAVIFTGHDVNIPSLPREDDAEPEA